MIRHMKNEKDGVFSVVAVGGLTGGRRPRRFIRPDRLKLRSTMTFF
jgi:hypothetical protein